MVDMDCSANARKTRMIMSNIGVHASSPSSSSSSSSPRRLASPKAPPASVAAPATPTASDIAAYEQYLRLRDLSALWAPHEDEFPEWRTTDAGVLRPALQGLEVTFRFASLVLSDRRPYTDRRLWARRVEVLAADQVKIIADLVAGDEYEQHHSKEEGEAGATGEHEGGGSSSRSSSTASFSASSFSSTHAASRLRGAPVTEIRSGPTPSTSPTSSYANLASIRARTSEVWKLPGEAPVESRTSEESLLPLLATWDPSKPLASRILDEIEAQFRGDRCPFTLGLGEPNLDAKPVLMYDRVCRAAALHALKLLLPKGSSSVQGQGETNQAVFTAHQVVECWVQVARQLLRRIDESIASAANETAAATPAVATAGFSLAASDCWALERIWKLLADIEDLHLLLDPDDFLRLRARLAISGPVLRSTALADAARQSRDLSRHVPAVLGVQADPTGGPALQDAAMHLFRRRVRGAGAARRVHLLQAFQAVDAAVKKFFFAYRQVVVAVMGSLEVEPDQAGSDPLAQRFMDPPCCPSVDAAKTFLGDHYCRRQRAREGHRQRVQPVSGENSGKSALTHL